MSNESEIGVQRALMSVQCGMAGEECGVREDWEYPGGSRYKESAMSFKDIASVGKQCAVSV